LNLRDFKIYKIGWRRRLGAIPNDWTMLLGQSFPSSDQRLDAIVSRWPCVSFYNNF